VAFIGTYCETPVLLVAVTETLEPVAVLSDTSGEVVDQAMVLAAGPLAGYTPALMVA
jgi:hypothetical protein